MNYAAGLLVMSNKKFFCARVVYGFALCVVVQLGLRRFKWNSNQ